MAINTALTTLKYGSCQVESTTVIGTITGSGNATVIVTAVGVVGSPITYSVAVLVDDTPFVVAEKIKADMLADSDLTDIYDVSGVGANIILTRIYAAANDATLNISIDNGTCTGLTTDLTSDAITTGVAYVKLVDIVNYPDMGSTPSKLDATDLTDEKYKLSILGLQEIPDLTFECNYVKATYNTIANLTDLYSLSLEFGTAGVYGIFTWNGHLSIFASGGGVDEVRKMNVICSAESEILVS